LQEAAKPGERSIHRPRTGEEDDAKDHDKHLLGIVERMTMTMTMMQEETYMEVNMLV
jgi:hypothetical protein